MHMFSLCVDEYVRRQTSNVKRQTQTDTHTHDHVCACVCRVCDSMRRRCACVDFFCFRLPYYLSLFPPPYITHNEYHTVQYNNHSKFMILYMMLYFRVLVISEHEAPPLTTPPMPLPSLCDVH